MVEAVDARITFLPARILPHIRLARSAAGLWDKRRRLHRFLPVMSELAAAVVADGREAARKGDRIRGKWIGSQPTNIRNRLAIYAHYSPTARVHEMTLRQLAHYGAVEIPIVFVTMSESLSEDDLKALRPLTRLIIHRDSFGRDFGAWRDSLPLIAREFPAPAELLLVNDSVLGPLRPMGHLFAEMRRRGPGLVGLTDSWMGPPHLQSYFLLAVGKPAVSDVFAFLNDLRLSQSPWLMVRRGEYALTRFMTKRRHPVFSMFPYNAVRAAAVRTGAAPANGPINPTHHAWRELIAEFGFPFIKRNLILVNPNSVPSVRNWRSALPRECLLDAAAIESYLEEMNRPRVKGRGVYE